MYQRISSILRQVCALAALVFGALSASLGSLHLPPAVSSVLVAAGAAIMAVEHYVSNPSTGSVTSATASPNAPPAPVGTPAPAPVTRAHTAP